MNYISRYCIVILLILLPSYVFAEETIDTPVNITANSNILTSPTIHSIPGYGNWHDPASWSEGRIPTENDIVEINGIINLNGIIYSNTNYIVRGIRINEGGQLYGIYDTLSISEVFENHGILNVGNVVLIGDITIFDSAGISGSIDFNNHSINLNSGASLTISGQISGTGTFYGNNTSLNTYGNILNASIYGSGLYINIKSPSTGIENTHFIAKDITIYSGANIVNMYRPGSWWWQNGPVVIDAQVDNFIVQTGATISMGYYGGNDIIHVLGNLINNGIISGGIVQVDGNPYAQLYSYLPISSSINIGSGITIVEGLTFGRDINFTNQTIGITDGGSITFSGQISGIVQFLGNNISLNTYNNIIGSAITGTGLTLNIKGVSTGIEDSHFILKNLILHSGANIVNMYRPGSWWWQNGPVVIDAQVDNFIVQTGATISMNTYLGGDTLTVHGSFINGGSIYGGSAFLYGNIENTGILSSSTHASWPPTLGATSYNIVFDPGSNTGFTTTATNYNISDKISGSYYWQVTSDNGTSYARKCINIEGCISSGGVTPVPTAPSPTNLTQQVQSPGLGREPIRSGEKIGKYQSGSGIILSASGNTTESARLVVEIYTAGNSTPTELSSGYNTDSTKELILPYLGAGDYRWRARIEAQSGAMSSWVGYGTDSTEEIDYTLYEGFEPYPYGYRFENSSPADGVLNGGIGTSSNGERYKINGAKWEIFDLAFSSSGSGSDIRIRIDGFEKMGLNQTKPVVFNGGNCFGLSLSALNKYYRPQTLNSEFPDFYSLLGASGTIWDNISAPIIGSGSRWNNYNTEFKTILAYQLYQKGDSYIQLSERSSLNQTPNDILNYLRSNPSKPYILTISGRTCYFQGICPTKYHAIVPYKVEGNKIYIWDNNVPFSTNNNESAYNQFIEVNPDNTWSSPYYNGDNFGWDYFEGLSLVNINDMYSLEQYNPIGFNGNDYAISLSGDSDVYFQDSQGRVSGFSGGTILEQIPGVIVVKNLGISKDLILDNTWKQIYLPQKLPGLTIRVSGKTTEPYDLMIAGGDYYTKVEGVTTSTGQLDSYQVTGTGLTIDFDNQKTGNYSLLTDNFQSSLTGTVFLSGITATRSPQQISYDWNKVIQKKSDAILYQVDTNSDGIYDLSSNYAPVPTSPNSTGSISGYVRGNTNATMAGWKVILTKQQDPVCKEDGKKGKDDKQKNKHDRECRDNEDDKRKNKDHDDREDSDHNKQIFAITDKKGYYRFMNLSPGIYSVSIESQKNWTILKPQNSIYNITLNSGQNIINLNFEANFLKGKNK